MGIKQEILDWFLAHPDKRVNNEQLREAIDNDDAQQVSVSLNALFNEVGLKREKVEGERGYTYWLPLDAAAGMQADSLLADAGKKKKAKASAGPKQSRVAKPKKEKAKRKYKKRAPPQPQPATDPTPANSSPGSTMFAIRNDGELGIDNGGNAVSLPRAEVQRLQAFLKTTSPLWSDA